jgi:hypothetical protein
MKIVDPLPDWSEPEAVRLWGEKISPRPINPWRDYMSYFVHPDVVAVVGRLLVPVFIEYEGGVFLRDQFTLEGYTKWRAQLGEVEAIEKMVNRQHAYDLFVTDEKIPEASFEGVANLMAQTLRLALQGSFPNRDFNVYVTNSDQDYGPTVVFHTVGVPPISSV